jgi:hypothetical protein
MNEKLAQTLWTMGGGHALGAEAVVLRAQEWAKEIEAEDPEKAIFNGKYSASIYLLLGYGFELLLKSAFIAHGGDPKLLGNKGLGHNLRAALEAAESQGFQSSAPRLHEIIDLLQQPHDKHHFRYGGLDDIPLPANVGDVVAILHHLASEIQALLFPNDQ